MSRDLPLPRHGLPPAAVRTPATLRDERRAAPTALAVVLALGVGVGSGLLLTTGATRLDAVGTERIGPWRLFGDAGSAAVNPYKRARMARTGEIPLAAAQGLTIVARHDSAGQPLDGRCTYLLSGPVPAARFWTLEAASTAGRPFANAAGREAFASTDVLRDVAGRFAVAIAPTVQPGNWLPLPGAGRFALVLRLYETGLTGLGSHGLASTALPAVTRLGCGP